MKLRWLQKLEERFVTLFQAPFKEDERLEGLVKKYRKHLRTGTGISLDGEGFTQDQKEKWDSDDRSFIESHRDEILTYLEPYRKGRRLVTNEDFERAYVLDVLLFTSKQAEIE